MSHEICPYMLTSIQEFLLQAKSSMDPHTYVSFLDTMVELRSLYKTNEIEDAIEVQKTIIHNSWEYFVDNI